MWFHSPPAALFEIPVKRSTQINVVLAVSTFAITAAVMFFLARVPTEALTVEALRSAMQRWESGNVSNYQIRYEMHGSLYDVYVQNGIVITATADGQPIRSADPGAYSVMGLFQTLELELENRSDPRGAFARQANTMVMRVRFNEKLGYVERYLRSSGGMGRGAAIVLLEFKPSE